MSCIYLFHFEVSSCFSLIPYHVHFLMYITCVSLCSHNSALLFEKSLSPLFHAFVWICILVKLFLFLFFSPNNKFLHCNLITVQGVWSISTCLSLVCLSPCYEGGNWGSEQMQFSMKERGIYLTKKHLKSLNWWGRGKQDKVWREKT